MLLASYPALCLHLAPSQHGHAALVASLQAEAASANAALATVRAEADSVRSERGSMQQQVTADGVAKDRQVRGLESERDLLKAEAQSRENY